MACVIFESLSGCAQIKQTAERWSEQRQLTQRAREAEEQGDTSQAAALLKQAVDADPRNCETRMELSELLLEHGSLDAATVQLRRIVKQNPDDPRTYVRLAEVLNLQGRYDEAEPLLRIALELDPGNPPGLLLFAQWLERRGQFDEALETYYRVLPLLGNPADAELRIATIKLRSGNTTQATALLRAVVENSQACPLTKAEAYSLLGRAYSQEERWHDAAVALETGLKVQSTPPTFKDWRTVAEAHARAGDWAAASRCAAAASQPVIPASGHSFTDAETSNVMPAGGDVPPSNAAEGGVRPWLAARP